MRVLAVFFKLRLLLKRMVNKKTRSSTVNNEVEVFSCVVLHYYAEGSEVNVRWLHYSLSLLFLR